MSTSGGTMLETLMRLTLPMPAARSALSNAFSGVPPSAVPAVTDAFVTCFQNIGISLRAARTTRAARPDVVIAPRASRIITGAKVKRKHFFLALAGPCSIIQPTCAPCRIGEVVIAATVNAAPPRRRRSSTVNAGRGRGRGSVLESLGRHLLLELYDCSSEALN